MKEIVLDYWNKNDFLSKFANIFEGEIIGDNVIKINNWFGRGLINHHIVEDAFMMMSMEMDIFDDVVIKRLESDKPYISIRYFITENNLTLKSRKIEKEFRSTQSMLASTPNFGVEIDLKKGMKLKYVVLVFRKDWLEKKVEKSFSQNLKELLYSNQPFYFYSPINYEISIYINELIQVTLSNDHWVKLQLNAASYGLLFKTIQEFAKVDRNYAGYSKTDLNKILSIKKILDECDFQTQPKLELLAVKSSMCVSKLSKIFKCVIGMTIFQYYHNLKMKRAMCILETQEFTVSETAYQLGYQNTSKFSSAFKKHFNIPAGQVLKRGGNQ